MPRAILSVSDKRGLVEFARGLHELGWELVSTGGTARALREAGIPVRGVSEVTGHPEIMDGRVKTLHPAIHAGILARAGHGADQAALEAQGYERVDLVAVNLYPFREAVAAGATVSEAMEQVDIGGPTMLRAAAKNHAAVLAVVDPEDYPRVLDALRGGAVTMELRIALARKVFAHTAAYDAAIAAYLAERSAAERAGPPRPEEALHDAAAAVFPDTRTLRLMKVQDLRYGENPDQPAAFYAEADAPAGSLPALEQLHGKELSFNNLLDIDAAVMAVSAWSDAERAACVVIKHTTPCGVALGEDPADAYARALECDPVSAFGGVVAFNRPVGAAAAEAMASTFLEVVIAPAFDPEALEVLTARKSLRLIVLPVEPAGADELDYKRVRGGLLVQRRMTMSFPEADWRVVTRREPTAEEWNDLRFAWRVVAAVKSNAIVLARGEQTLGIGAGQMSRVDSSRIAVMKANDQGLDLAGAVVASDAFFPFRDGVDAAAEAGARAVIQPGGSIRDAEVIAAADEHGMAMVFTGRRVFRH
ncbi:MAG TPA: bifunctional phosphoribosylaminoimidazolecarboxamide formyltransferase/IMP cyclohydrolase [Longimicrobiales bacterium]